MYKRDIGEKTFAVMNLDMGVCVSFFFMLIVLLIVRVSNLILECLKK